MPRPPLPKIALPSASTVVVPVPRIPAPPLPEIVLPLTVVSGASVSVTPSSSLRLIVFAALPGPPIVTPEAALTTMPLPALELEIALPCTVTPSPITVRFAPVLPLSVLPSPGLELPITQSSAPASTPLPFGSAELVALSPTVLRTKTAPAQHDALVRVAGDQVVEDEGPRLPDRQPDQVRLCRRAGGVGADPVVRDVRVRPAACDLDTDHAVARDHVPLVGGAADHRPGAVHQGAGRVAAQRAAHDEDAGAGDVDARRGAARQGRAVDQQALRLGDDAVREAARRHSQHGRLDAAVALPAAAVNTSPSWAVPLAVSVTG